MKDDKGFRKQRHNATNTRDVKPTEVSTVD